MDIDDKERRIIHYNHIIVVFAPAGIISISNYHHKWVQEREFAATNIKYIEEERNALANLIEISSECFKRDNTIACYGYFDNLFFAGPKGSGKII